MWHRTVPLIVLACLLQFCTRKSPVRQENLTGMPLPDTASLFLDSVSVNGVATESLSVAFDSAAGCSLARVCFHLSRCPKYNSDLAWCNRVSVENGSNDRFVCYTCLTFPGCADSTRAFNYVDFSIIIDIDTVRDTSAIVEFLFQKQNSLGKDTGSVRIHLHDLFDRVFSDTTELDTSVNLYW